MPTEAAPHPATTPDTQPTPTTTGAPTHPPSDPAPEPADLDSLRAQASASAQRAEQLALQLASTEATLAQTRAALDAAERRRQIDAMLAEADALDLETARLMTEATLAHMDDGDIALAIADLRERKPFLFAPERPSHAGALAAPDAAAAHQPQLIRLATHAAQSGDRAALIDYLRARRTARAAG